MTNRGSRPRSVRPRPGPRQVIRRVAAAGTQLVLAHPHDLHQPVRPGLPPADRGRVETWRRPLQQPGFAAAISYTLQHGIPAMTTAQLVQLKASPLPKRVIYGADDPQLSAVAAAQAAARIGAPAPVAVPGRHLIMISSPRPLAAISAFAASFRP